MKSSIPFFVLALSSLSSAIVLPNDPHLLSAFSTASSEVEEQRLIQLSPFETRWATESEKLELKRQGRNFMDITEHQDLGLQNALTAATTQKKHVTFPEKPAFQDTIKPLLKKLDKSNMQANLEKFTSFYTRYARSDHGRQSSEWLLNRINETANAFPGLELAPFKHTWQQSSIIARIPGRTEKTVVIGAHQDSINLFLPSLLGAPGADDDGSGTVTILEAFRVFVEYLATTGTQLEQTVEFMWYSAEELGLWGSQAIFSAYEKEGRDVVAMLQQDMTGYVEKTLNAGKPEAVGVITDFVDEGLTEFIKSVITEVSHQLLRKSRVLKPRDI
jgi:leucyl aminopeptidase